MNGSACHTGMFLSEWFDGSNASVVEWCKLWVEASTVGVSEGLLL